MKIKWVNHASYILEYKDVRLITDPWVEGRVFNDSWGLLAKTQLKYSDFKNITHIWFSHEHPDHFFPPNIQKIPKEIRSEITVVFQKTEDSKVVEYCKNIGFKSIIEVDVFNPLFISENIEIEIGKVKNDTDSWLHLKTPDFSILNLNDCVLSDVELEILRKKFENVDVLLTQFSFATWAGNKFDTAKIKGCADGKLVELKRQINCFKPKFTIPFASYVWFCNEDNFHFNAFANKIDLVYDYIKGLNSQPIVLYPGDEWSLTIPNDSENAISKYFSDISNLSNRKLSSFDTISLDTMQKASREFVGRALSKNNKQKLFRYSPMICHLKDRNEVFSFSYENGLHKVNISPENADISFHSQNLYYCFKFDWGFDTILIAGTYQKPEGGDFQNFLEDEWVSNLNNQGKRMKGLIGRVFDKLLVN